MARRQARGQPRDRCRTRLWLRLSYNMRAYRCTSRRPCFNQGRAAVWANGSVRIEFLRHHPAFIWQVKAKESWMHQLWKKKLVRLLACVWLGLGLADECVCSIAWGEGECKGRRKKAGMHENERGQLAGLETDANNQRHQDCSKR